MPEPVDVMMLTPLQADGVLPVSDKRDTILLICSATDLTTPQVHNCSWTELPALIKQYPVNTVIYIAAKDRLPLEDIALAIRDYSGSGITLLIRRIPPPDLNQRMDGVARSFMMPASVFVGGPLHLSPAKLLFEIVYRSLHMPGNAGVKVIQLPLAAALPASASPLQDSLLVIPHKGSNRLLRRCLLQLQQTQAPTIRSLCFDDVSYRPLLHHKKPESLQVYAGQPKGAGPYPLRHFAIMQSQAPIIFFQDSDDVPAKHRYETLMTAMERHSLDMAGSHEIRMDEFSGTIQLFRYPLQVNEALANGSAHPFFFPTACIRRAAYLQTGGFSMDKRFGYDTQFLLRAALSIKIGNADEFLYIRFKRPNSLTTHKTTGIGSPERETLTAQWFKDYREIIAGNMTLETSSLMPNPYHKTYKLENIRW